MRKKKEIVTENKEVSQEEQKEAAKIDIKKIAENNRKAVIEDFKKGILHLHNYDAVSKFKSIRRAIRRGHVSIFGDLYPHRPYNNSKCSINSLTYRKKFIYAQVKGKNKIY